MTDRVDTLAQAFRCLTDEELGNMQRHRDDGVKVLAGCGALDFVNSGGFV